MHLVLSLDTQFGALLEIIRQHAWRGKQIAFTMFFRFGDTEK